MKDTATINDVAEQVKRLRLRVEYKTSLMVFVISLLVMVTATLAWFTISGLAGTDGMDLNCTTGNDLKVATSNLGNDINRYEKSITNEMINSQLSAGGYKTLDNVKLLPLSTVSASSNIGTQLFLQDGTDRTQSGPASGEYLLVSLWFISDNDVKVYLTDKETKAGAADGTKITSVTENTTQQADIIKTARISFTPDGESTKIYETEDRVYAKQNNAFSNISKNSDSNLLFSLKASTPKQVTLRIWIEGEDPLCVDDVANAAFNVQLMFEAVKEN